MARAPEIGPAAEAPDYTAVLLLYGVMILVIPEGLTIAGLEGPITPVGLLGMACGFLWVLGRVVAQPGLATGRQPIRTVVYLYGASVLASYVIAASAARAGVEARAADRGLLVTVAFCGTILLAADGIRDRARLDLLIRVLVAAGAVAAAIGIVQFMFGLDLTQYLAGPGLSRIDTGYGFTAITERSGFNRVSGTALWPIEFSAMLTMLVPLALHLAYWRKQARWWLAAGLITAAIPMSVSRTGTVGLLAVLIVLVPTWDRQRRREFLRVGILMVVALKLAAPGLLGTIRALFLSFFVDPSITSRRDDYAYVGEFIGQHPVFGRGYGTFLPESYDFLDNQYLLSLVETGIVGVVALVAVFAVAFALAIGTRRASDDPVTRDLAQSLAAAVVVPLATCATFDFLSFPSARGIAALVVGCSGALWRIERSSSPARRTDESAEVELVDGTAA